MKGRIVVTGGGVERRRELVKALEDGGYFSLSGDAFSDFLASIESAPPVALLLLYPDPAGIVPIIFAECADLSCADGDGAPLRLTPRQRSGGKRRGILKVGDLELDRESLLVTLRALPLPLDPIHARLLEFLMRGIGRAFSRREIADGVWGSEAVVDERTVDVVVGRIRDAMRHKVAVDPILTVRSVGHGFNEQFKDIKSLPKRQRLSPPAETFPRKRR